MNPTFWRIQDAGFNLSASHCSETWGEGEGEQHEATSCVRELEQLYGAGAWLGQGEIEIVALEGVEIGIGPDREPIVVPTVELRRFRHAPTAAWRKTLLSVTTVEELLAAGWTEVPTLPVLD